MKNQSKSIYKFWSNIIFYFRIWIKVYPQFIILLILAVPSGIIASYSMSLIPKIIVEGIEKQLTIGTVFVPLISFSFLMVIMNAISSHISMVLMEKGIIAKTYLNSDIIFMKITNLSYNKLVDSDIQDKIAKIKEIMSEGDKGTMHQFGRSIVLLFTSLFGILYFAIDIVKIDFVLLGIIVFTSSVNAIYGIWTNRYQSKNMEQRSNASKKANYLRDVFQNRQFFKDIRIYNMVDWLSERFNTHSKEFFSYILKSVNVSFAAVVINAFMLFIRDIFVYLYLIFKLLDGQISISYFVFMLGLVKTFSNWVNEIIAQFNKLILFSISVEHIRDFLSIDEQNYIKNVSPEIQTAPEIKFESLSFKYPGSQKWIFKNFNLTIAKEEKIALVGNNGAGKTTLMLLLMGLLEPTEGRILINGHDSKLFDKSDYYKLFSPVFQDINIFPESINANIAGSLNYDNIKIKNVIDGSGLSAFVNNLQDKGNTLLLRTSRTGAIDLSGGLSQKVLLARALYKNALINILDEPSAALDSIAESEMYEAFNDMSKDKTSIFISHRLASSKFCDRILLLEFGKIAEEGTHAELMEKQGQYAEMFEIQSQYYLPGGASIERK